MENILPFLLGSSLTLLAYPLLKVGYRLTPYLRRNTSRLLTVPNGYVLVAGSTDGIGLHFTKRLSQLGLGIIAIGRNQTKLQQLQLNYPKAIVYQTDFSTLQGKDDQRQELSETITSHLSSLNSDDSSPRAQIVGMVNSVGSAHFSPYDRLTSPEIATLHNTNIHSLHFLLQLNQTLRQRDLLAKESFFINVSSTVAQKPVPYSTVYAATKAYISGLIAGVSQERKDVVFLDVRPWFVTTKMVGFLKTWDAVEPGEVVKGSLQVLGRRTVCSGCWKHELVDEFSWIFSNELSARREQQMEKVRRVEAMLKARKKR